MTTRVDPADAHKRQAAERALAMVEDGMVLGLGTGSTARHVVELLAEHRAAGRLRNVVGVVTSRQTERHAREHGIPLAELDDRVRPHLTLDGADEVDPALNLIKGHGGALLWEKIVAAASGRLVIVVDESKLVSRLGERFAVPVEVVPFGWRVLLEPFRRLGAEPTLRTGPDGSPFVTDGGHYLIDCAFPGGIPDPAALERALRSHVGVVETGLFLGMASAVVVAGATGVRVLEPAATRGSP